MAVIKNINKSVFKRKLHKRYNYTIDDLDNELRRWYESSKGAQDRMASWNDEDTKIRKYFGEIRANEEREFRNEMNRKMQEFSQRQNVSQEEAKKFQEEMNRLDQEYNLKREATLKAFESKMKEYENLVKSEVNSQNNSQNNLINNSNLNPVNGNIQVGNKNDDVVSNPLPSSVTNPPSHTEISKSSNLNREGNDRNSNRDTSISNSINDSIDETNASGIPQKPQNSITLSLFIIIIVTVVVVASAAVFVIRKRKKARQFNDFDLKPNFESDGVQVVTDNQRVITDSVINGYANDYSQAEGQENINVNGENTTNVEQVSEQVGEQIVDQVSDQSFPVSPTSGKELTIDDFIPLMKYK